MDKYDGKLSEIWLGHVKFIAENVLEIIREY